MHEDNPYMHDDKPYMYRDNPYMYDIIQICTNDKPDIKDDKTDINDDMTDMYEYHIHVWYHVAWGDYIAILFLRFSFNASHSSFVRQLIFSILSNIITSLL